MNPEGLFRDWFRCERSGARFNGYTVLYRPAVFKGSYARLIGEARLAAALASVSEDGQRTVVTSSGRFVWPDPHAVGDRALYARAVSEEKQRLRELL